MKFWNYFVTCFLTFLLTAESSVSSIPCPDGWDCKISSEKPWQASSAKLSLSIYYYNTPKVVIFCDNGRGDDDLPADILANFIFPTDVTDFAFSACSLPRNITYADILGNQTVETFRIISKVPLEDELTPELFKGFDNLTYFDLNNCGLRTIPEDILKYSPNVITLKLRENTLTTLPSKMFQFAPNLVNLDLGNNQLVSLTDSMPGLTYLEVLLLYHNQIERISRDFFDSAPHLQTLDLQNNQLTQFSDDLLRIPRLKSLKMFRNQLESLPENLLANQTRMTVFSCSDNPNLSILPPNLLRNTPALVTLEFARCNISEIPPAFLNYTLLINVTSVSFLRNNLQDLHPKLFSKLTNLTSVDVSFNELTTIRAETFAGLRKLELLLINNNVIVSIEPGAFSYQEKLKELHLSHNNLQSIDESLFDFNHNLQLLDLSHNKLTYPDPTPRPFKLPSGVIGINLSYNYFKSLPSSWLLELPFLEMLSLQHNDLTIFRATDCQPISSKLRLDISYNNISRADFDMTVINQLKELNISPNPLNEQAKVILERNPFICDCLADGMLTYAQQQQVDNRYGFVLQIENLLCSGPESYRGQYLKALHQENLICILKEECPTPCQCLMRAAGNVVEVDCSNLNLTSVPTIAPKFTSVLKIDHNDLTDFANISSPAWDHLTKLYIANNKISTAENVKLPNSIEELDLRDNKLTVMDQTVLNALNDSGSFRRILFQNNPWDCSNCENIELREFLKSNIDRVGNVSTLFCYGTKRQLYLEPICEAPPTLTKTVLISTVVVCFVMAIGFAAAAVCYYRFNHEIKVWLYAHKMCLWFVKEKELDKNKRFDAFISFSQEDEEFVSSQLVPGLEENEPFYKLCIHQRDWLAGEWIPDQIIRSVQDSRRTIVVLSKNFIKSVWGRLEFKTAHHQALQDRTNRIIILVFGDLPPASEMDPELKMYVKFNTYLQWGDDWFWQKLRYAMPHCPVRSSSILPQSFKSLKDPRKQRKSGDPNRMATRLANLNGKSKT
ncbi:hypothetical protein CHUAL_009774 [Chamberlinius hualienensis]